MQVSFRNFVISSSPSFETVQDPFKASHKGLKHSTSHEYHFKHEVDVVNTENDQSITFDFYGSIADYKAGLNELEYAGLMNAFECLLSDATAGNMTFPEFCSELGYDDNSINHQNIWKKCKAVIIKLEYIGIGISDAYDLINEINEMS